MRKVVFAAIAAFAAILFAPAANAGGYVSGYATTTADDGVEMFDKLSFDASVGYAFSNGIRLEADVFTANIYDGLDTTDIPNVSAVLGVGLVKGLYDIKMDGKITPYFGIGLIPSSLTADKSDVNLNIDGAFVGGVSFAVNNQISLDLQYNRNFTFALTGNTSTISTTTAGDSTFKAGIRYNF